MAESTGKTAQEFVLKPFEPETAPKIAIAGSVSRQGNQLHITYQLEDPSSQVALPTQVAHPERRHELWQTTCLEFFLGLAESKHYWEFNLSPAGHWNCYRFEDYRQGMAEEGAIATLSLNRVGNSGFTATVELGAITPSDAPLALGVTAVIEDMWGMVSYWAIAHTDSEADFHRRDSFVLQL